jgi:CTP:molybdopterin cytidylyltransferase MocA
MGEPKLFLPVFGQSMLRLAVSAVGELGPTVVVTGAYPVETRDHLSDFWCISNITFAHNANWRKGMASSIAIGVKAAEQHAPDGYLIVLADQPTVCIESLGEHLDAFLHHPQSIVATWYPERLGVPAIFPARFAADLRSGEGSRGARQLIAQEGDSVKVIRFKAPLRDIDTPEDYRQFTSGSGQTSPTNNDPS